MIEAKNSDDKYCSCNSCGGDENILKIRIGRSNLVNSFCIYLCKKCTKLLIEELQKIKRNDAI